MDIKDTIDKIHSLESEVEQRISSAKEAATKIIEDALDEKEKIITHERESVSRECDDILKVAEAEGKREGKKIVEAAQREAGEIREKSVHKTEKAIRFIMASFFKGLG